MLMATMTILDPTAASSATKGSLAPRPASLDGLRIGLLHNTKPGGEILLQAISERFARDYRLKSILWRRKPLPTLPASFVNEMADQCDVVVAALGDWGSCTSWSFHDSAVLERSGVPTVTFIGDKFEPLAKSVAIVLGIKDLRYVTVPHPINTVPNHKIPGLALDRYQAVLDALLDNRVVRG
jgi:hypothetical protein